MQLRVREAGMPPPQATNSKPLMQNGRAASGTWAEPGARRQTLRGVAQLLPATGTSLLTVLLTHAKAEDVFQAVSPHDAS